MNKNYLKIRIRVPYSKGAQLRAALQKVQGLSFPTNTIQGPKLIVVSIEYGELVNGRALIGLIESYSGELTKSEKSRLKTFFTKSIH